MCYLENIEILKRILWPKSKLKYEAMIAVSNGGRGYHSSCLTWRKLPFVTKNGSHLQYHHHSHAVQMQIQIPCLLWPRMGPLKSSPLSWLIWKSRKFKVKLLSSVPQYILCCHLKTYRHYFKLFSWLKWQVKKKQYQGESATRVAFGGILKYV